MLVAQKCIVVCCMTITSVVLLRALWNMAGQGIHIKMLCDLGAQGRAQFSDRKVWERLSRLPNVEIRGIAHTQPDAKRPRNQQTHHFEERTMLLHIKCIIVDRELLISGSANFTNASEEHLENMFCVNHPDLIREHAAQLHAWWQRGEVLDV